MIPLQLRRICTLMEPEPGNSSEAEGVLNPAATRGPDGNLYLFPRLVGKGNYSRIGIAKVLFAANGDPCGVERLGVALEPETDYETTAPGVGGCEDPRVTYVSSLKQYVMTYVALTAHGPRIAFAISEDLFKWRRLGLATFLPYKDIEFDGINNKDSCVFPTPIPDPNGDFSLALLHRPLFPGTTAEARAKREVDEVEDAHRECIWISYSPLNRDSGETEGLCHFTSHQRLAVPVSEWEQLKIGSGTPPVLTDLGWLLLYHGVHERDNNLPDVHKMAYCAGAMILESTRPTDILFRSTEPILKPELPEETVGVIADVVFPTGIDRRDDIGQPRRFDVYYGMADDKIGVASLELPEAIPTEGNFIKKPL